MMINVMTKQKEERVAEMDSLRRVFMKDVKEEMKQQLTEFREEIRREIFNVREEFIEKVSTLEDKQNEMGDIQSIMDCKVDKLEEELRAMVELVESQRNGPRNGASTEENDEFNDATAKLVQDALRVVGFKPIESRDIARLKRMNDIEDDDEAMKLCLREFWRIEMRIPSHIMDELTRNIKKVWSPVNQDWDRLYVEFEDERFVKLCFSYAKFLKDKDTQIMQYFSPEFADQFRSLDAIAYQLRHPQSSNGVKFKTRIRYGQHCLELQKRHPHQRVWIKVAVPNLPPVDLDPVPPPTMRTSPPVSRTRTGKRPRSSPGPSPTSEKSEKSSKVDDSKTVHSIPINDEITHINADQSFVFKSLVDKFANK